GKEQNWPMWDFVKFFAWPFDPMDGYDLEGSGEGHLEQAGGRHIGPVGGRHFGLAGERH
ncbi:hypothetical protein L195_g062086, partial [Trifolium pratense]